MGYLTWSQAFSTSELLSLSLDIWELQLRPHPRRQFSRLQPDSRKSSLSDKQRRLSQRPSAFRQPPSSSAGRKRQPHQLHCRLPAPKPAPSEKRPAPSPELADDVRPTQQQRRVSPVTNTSATTDGGRQVRATLRRSRRSKGCRWKAMQTTQQVLVSEGLNIPRGQTRRWQRPDETLNIDLPAYFYRDPSVRAWTLFKGPTSKYHNETLWNYLDNYADIYEPIPGDERMWHIDSHQSRSRGQIRQGAATLQRPERGRRNEHLFATVMASGNLLLPNWLPGHHVLKPIFGLTSHSKLKKNRLLNTLFIRQTLTFGCVCA